MALYDSTGSLFATYDYDAWGKVISIKDAGGNNITSDSNFAIINPIRYRGYYYDNESGLYYLQSRYYDPTTGRFLNTDSVEYLGASDSIKNYNLFSYCDNNPVILFDPDGTIAITTCVIIGAIAGAVIGGEIGGEIGYSQAVKNKVAKSDQWKYVVGYGLGGAVIGGVIGGLIGYACGTIAPYVVKVSSNLFRLSNSGLKIASKAAFKAASKVGIFSVPLKHLANAGGRYAKFATTNTSQIQNWISQALRSSNAFFYPNNSSDSFYIIADIGKTIGTKGEHFIKVVFDTTGKIWTAFPVK